MAGIAGIESYDDEARGALTLDDAVVALGISGTFPEQPRRTSSATLRALRDAGNEHVYVDSADLDAIVDVACGEEGRAIEEIDGNTINQPLLVKVLDERLEGDRVRAWARALREHEPGLAAKDLVPLLYTILLARVGGAIVKRLAGDRAWEVSLQLHMSGVGDLERSVRWGRYLRSTVAPAYVKVPFAPHAPECLLIARDLEQQGVPVNFTSTFSARQAVVAAMLAHVGRTNVFMGRIDAGLEAERAGAEACLAAQRALREIRREHERSTRLIVASVRGAQAIVQTAGCDVVTAPPEALAELLGPDGGGPEQIESRLETSHRDDLAVAPEVEQRIGRARIERLFDVEPELLEFLATYGASDEFREARDGEAVARRFDEAGFGDFFATPSETEWKELARSKVPEAGSDTPPDLALDTEFSLRADADFAGYQERIDAAISTALRD